jgi:translation elongation factor EF-Ts
MTLEVTAARVNKLREETGMGMHEAKRHLTKKDLLEEIQSAKDFTDLRELLVRIVELIP